ncbi:hypothetical protein MHU86_9497 [Fragilaria crotonensis]|nr:hypothetical protein MHU86_9497 [Fragilaria crotonensis]
MAHRIHTPGDLLRIGLFLVGFDLARQQAVDSNTNVRRFKSHFGSSPVVCAVLWEDLITTDIQEARVVPAPGALDKFLMCLYFLKTYATEEKLSAFSKLNEKTARKWIWFFASKIQALKTKKVRKQAV